MAGVPGTGAKRAVAARKNAGHGSQPARRERNKEQPVAARKSGGTNKAPPSDLIQCLT